MRYRRGKRRDLKESRPTGRCPPTPVSSATSRSGSFPRSCSGYAITPFYNRFLRESAETVVRLTERPAVTHLYPAPKSETRANQEIHYLVITRDDHSAKKGFLYSVRTTDLHFPMVYLWAMFMAVPGVPLDDAARPHRLGHPDPGVLPRHPAGVLGEVRLRHPARRMEPGSTTAASRRRSGAWASTCSTYRSSSACRSSCSRPTTTTGWWPAPGAKRPPNRPAKPRLAEFSTRYCGPRLIGHNLW